MKLTTSRLKVLEDENKVIRYISPSDEVMEKIKEVAKITANDERNNEYYMPIVVGIEDQPLLLISHLADVKEFYNNIHSGKLKIDTTLIQIYAKEKNKLLYSIAFNIIYNYLNFSEDIKHNIEVEKQINDFITKLSDHMEKKNGIGLYSRIMTVKTPSETLQHVKNHTSTIEITDF